MKSIDILDWICRESIDGEFLNMVEVPEEGEHEWEQNEDWWINQFGNYPPYPIAAGKYLYRYGDTICHQAPDAEIELATMDGFEYIYLYQLED